MDERTRRIKSYVVRTGRMTHGQEAAYHKLKAVYGIPFQDTYLDLNTLAGDRPVIVEIGFGMGHSTARIAQLFPENFYIGIEVYPSGVGSLLAEIEARHLTNLRIIQHDAVEVLSAMIPEGALSGVHLFFPDPWPKKRHHKRRLIQDAFLSDVHDKLEPGGYVYAVTDWENYAEHIQGVFKRTQGFIAPFARYAAPIPWRPETRFERKGLKKAHNIYENYLIKTTQ